MLLGLIFSIMTATYSLSSTTTVEVSGDIPENSNYTYARSASTGQKGQMTAGNSTCLSLTGWEGCTIHSIGLQMHSNTNSGRGSLSVRIGAAKVWEIHNQEFSDSAWYGSYSTDWVNIQREMACEVPEDGNIDIIASATENSIYINSYTICYTPAAPKAYTITFITGFDSVPDAMTQETIGAPIALPAWPDTLEWYFLGWSEKEIELAHERPEVMPARSMYTPKCDMRLWAIYTDNDDAYASIDYSSGDYVIAQINELTEHISGPGMGWAMHSKVFNNEVALRTVDIGCDADNNRYLHADIQTDMIYTIQFLSDSTLQIRNAHSGEYIGYEAQNLSPVAVAWNYHSMEDGSLAIYYPYNDKHYALWMGYGPQGTSQTAVAYAQSITLSTWVKDGFWLFPAVVSEYTSWPCGKWNAIEKTEVDSPLSSEYVIHFGVYQLCIQNGKKYLKLAR